MRRVAPGFILGCFSCVGGAQHAAAPHAAPAPSATSRAAPLASASPQPAPKAERNQPEAGALLPLWAGARQVGQLPAPSTFKLPDVVADVASAPNGTAWVLGDSAALYRLEGKSVVKETDGACVEPRPKDLPPDEPWPDNMNMRHAHGLSVTPSAVELWLASPGATAEYFFVARRDRAGKLRCDLPPYLVGGGDWAEVRAGGRLYNRTYTGFHPVFPDRSEAVPNHPELHTGLLVPVYVSGSPPIVWPENSWVLSRFNGVRWEQTALPELPQLDRETVVVDESGILWGIAHQGSEGKTLVVAYDGNDWLGGAVPAVEAPRAVLPAGADRAWLVGDGQVSYRRGDRFFTGRFELRTRSGMKVDDLGQLWVWGNESGPGQEPSSDTVLRFAPPQEAP
ncbi:MAG: hypothetical protein JW940_39060 [Polyangiaceae bacterium]|nr:hypothetical protein [Polyangiaceae bacterium]